MFILRKTRWRKELAFEIGVGGRKSTLRVGGGDKASAAWS